MGGWRRTARSGGYWTGYGLFEYSWNNWSDPAAGSLLSASFWLHFAGEAVYNIEYHRGRVVLLCFGPDPVLALCGAGGLLGADDLRQSCVPRFSSVLTFASLG